MLVYALVMHMNTEAKLIFAFFTFLDLKIYTLFIFFHCEPSLKWYNKILYDYIFFKKGKLYICPFHQKVVILSL